MTIKLETFINFFLASAVIGVAISYSKLYLFHVALVLLIFVFIKTNVNNFKIKLPKLPTKLHYIFYFMFIWYSLSVLWSIKSSYSMIYLVYLLFGLFIILIMVYYIRDISIQDKVFKILGIIFIVEIIFCLLEVFTNFRLPISPFSEYVTYFGRDMKMNDLSDLEIAYLMDSPTGFEWNPNNLAVVMVVILPFFLLLTDLRLKIVGSISIFIIIIMSGSRGVFMTSLLILFLYFLLLNKKRFLKSLIVLPLFIIFLLSISASLKQNNNVRFEEIMTSVEVLEMYLSAENAGNNSVGYRQKLIENGLNALRDSYYIGVGGGANVAVQEKLGGVDAKLTSMHNFWIEMLVDSGVFFFIIFICWYIYITYRLYVIGIFTNSNKYRYYSLSLFLSMVAFLPAAISASSVIYELPMWLLFGFAIANINNYKRYRNETSYVG